MKGLYLVLSFLMCLPILAQGDDDFLVYAETDEGDYPLPKEIFQLVEDNPKNFQRFRWGEYQGPKLRIGVLDVGNSYSQTEVNPEDGTIEYEGTKMIPVESIENLVTNGLVNTNRFTIIDRHALQDILKENDKAKVGISTKESSAKAGRILGARYLVRVDVNAIEPDYSSSRVGLGVKRLGFTGGKDMSMVSLTFGLIDAETGVIVFSKRVQVVVSKKSFGASGKSGRFGKKKASASGSMKSKTPITHALNAAINVGVFELVKKIGNEPISGTVAVIKSDQAIVTLGKENVRSDSQFIAYSKGEEIIDPNLGISLGSDEERVGLLRVTKVKSRFCYTEPVGFDINLLTVGDRVELKADVPDLKFAEKWEGPTKKTINPMKKKKKKKREQRQQELRAKAKAKEEAQKQKEAIAVDEGQDP